MKKLLLILFLLLPFNLHAAVVEFAGFETGVLTEGSDIASRGGTVDISVIAKNGSYSFRSNPATTATGSGNFRPPSANGDAGVATTNLAGSGVPLYISFWFRVSTCPSTGYELMGRVTNSANTTITSMRMYPDCSMKLSNLTTESASTTPFSLDTWHHIGLYVCTGSCTAELYIDGALEASYTDTFSGTTIRSVVLGKYANTNGNSVDFRYDDLIIDDAELVSSTAQVAVLVPNAVGTYSQWTGGTNGSDWQEVDEIPFDTATYAKSTAAGDKYSANVTDTSTAGISGTIKSVEVVSFVTEDASTASTAFQTLTISGSTEATTTNRADMTNATVGNVLILQNDPNTGAAWTTSALDSLEVGGVAVTVQTTQFRLRATYASVLYVPSVGGGGDPEIIKQSEIWFD